MKMKIWVLLFWEKKEKEILESLKAFEDGVVSRQQTSTSSIDSALSEFNSWKEQLRQQMEEYSSQTVIF